MMATQGRYSVKHSSWARTSPYVTNSSTSSVVNEVPNITPNTPTSNLPKDEFYKFRRWRDTDFGRHLKQNACTHYNGISFNLMSYNILAQDLLELHPYLYQNHTQSSLKWGYKLGSLKKEILAVGPDILCLQEVQHNHLGIIVNNLNSLNYDYVFKKHTERSDGCAIFFNKNLFTLDERHSVEFYQPNIEYLDRKHVAIIAKLSLKSDPTTSFIVSTTHLLYNPRREDIRLAQIQVLLAELDRVSMIAYNKNGEPIRLPIILSGDFNLRPWSTPYKLVTDGIVYYRNLTKPTLETMSNNFEPRTGNIFLPPQLGITDNCQHFDIVNNQYQTRESRLQNLEMGKFTVNNADQGPVIMEQILATHPDLFSSGRLTHNLNLTSVYSHKRYRQREATTFQNRWLTVDYIFYTKSYSPNRNSLCDGSLKLISEYTLPTVAECRNIGFLPNKRLGSDHLSLAARFFLKKSVKE